MLYRLAYRFLDAFEEEERCWNIYPAPFASHPVMVADDSRWVRLGPGKFPVPFEGVVRQETFKSRAEAMHFVRVECIRAGLRHLLCFWRKNPK